MGAANTPMSGVRLSVASGNHVVAKPLGVRDGIDYQHTGEVRRIDTVGVGHDHEPVNHVFQLADIAGPGVTL